MKEIIDRVKKSCGYDSDAALARALGMSPQNFLSRKKSGGIKETLILHAIEKGINEMWLRTGQGEMKAATGQKDTDQVTLRDILKLHEEIHKLATEIGEIKTRLIDASQTGDIKRLGVMGGKG